MTTVSIEHYYRSNKVVYVRIVSKKPFVLVACITER